MSRFVMHYRLTSKQISAADFLASLDFGASLCHDEITFVLRSEYQTGCLRSRKVSPRKGNSRLIIERHAGRATDSQ